MNKIFIIVLFITLIGGAVAYNMSDRGSVNIPKEDVSIDTGPDETKNISNDVSEVGSEDEGGAVMEDRGVGLTVDADKKINTGTAVDTGSLEDIENELSLELEILSGDIDDLSSMESDVSLEGMDADITTAQ